MVPSLTAFVPTFVFKPIKLHSFLDAPAARHLRFSDRHATMSTMA
jgi:hypothetical protein